MVDGSVVVGLDAVLRVVVVGWLGGCLAAGDSALLSRRAMARPGGPAARGGKCGESEWGWVGWHTIALLADTCIYKLDVIN